MLIGKDHILLSYEYSQREADVLIGAWTEMKSDSDRQKASELPARRAFSLGHSFQKVT